MSKITRRRFSHATLATLGRDIGEQTLALERDALTACWQCLGDAHELEITARRQEILEFLREVGEATGQEIADAIGQDRSNTYRRLQDLRAAGRAEKVRSRPPTYKLA